MKIISPEGGYGPAEPSADWWAGLRMDCPCRCAFELEIGDAVWCSVTRPVDAPAHGNVTALCPACRLSLTIGVVFDRHGRPAPRPGS